MVGCRGGVGGVGVVFVVDDFFVVSLFDEPRDEGVEAVGLRGAVGVVLF